MALGRGNIEIDIRGRVDTAGIARQVQTAEKQIRPLNVSLNNEGFRQPLGQISGDLAEFQKSLDASVARTLAFGAAVGVINAVSNGFKALIVSATEVEKALTDVNVILNLNGSALQQFSDQLFDVAKNTGQSFQSVSEAAVELSRQGLGAEETLSRINDAMILTRLSGMDAAKSVETLTAAVNSFGSAALTTTDLVNKLATVDAAFAVSTEDLANGLARSGATAQAAKVDLNELLAAITSVQQTTARGGAVIGNAFKSIFTRIQRSGVREALEEIGVETTDAAGNIRGALDILQDYAGVYSTLSDSQRAYTDELVAGVFQINNLRALVKDLGSDYSIYQRALEQSNGATDEAVRRNQQLQDTLSALINEAAVNAKELAASLGELVATPAVENLLEVFNSISGALRDALDPEEGSKLIQGMFGAIGNFIAGPGLLLIGVAFIKLFKFITSQSIKAAGEIFKIGSATDGIAKSEAKIGFLLKNNQSLYEAISNEALSHEKREEMVLQTIKAQNQAYQQQQAMISRLASSRQVQTSLGTAATGYIPNFANGIAGAINAEKEAVSSGVGGASNAARPKVLKNFPMGGGKRQTVVANTDEVIVPKFGGGTGSAIFNQDMISKFGMPDGAIPVSRGYVPNFAKSTLQTDKRFQDVLSDFKGINVDVQKDLSGFGMLSAKGARDNLSVTKKSGFSKDAKQDIINSIGGAKLNQDDKNYLLSTIGGKKKTRFSNIPAQTLETADPKKIRGKVGALNDMINPYIADAVANVSANIYTKVLGDEVSAQNLVKKVRSSANADQGIISVGAQGDIFESAIRLGSAESAKGLARDDRSAIWDFEESGPISADLKSIFFSNSSIVKADAKRTGDQDSAGEVVDKAYKNTFDEQLKDIYSRSWAPIVNAAVQASPAKSKTERKRFGTNLAGGYIPNFATAQEKTEEWISAISKMKKFDQQKNPLFYSKNAEKLHDSLNIDPAIITKVNFSKSTTSNKPKVLQKAQNAQGVSPAKYKEIYDNLTRHNKYKNLNNDIQKLTSKGVIFKTQKEIGPAIGESQLFFGANWVNNKKWFTNAGLDVTKLDENLKKLVINEATIKETKVVGDNFEDFVATLGEQKFIKGPDAFDFAKSQKRGLKVNPETKKQINMMAGTRFGDAEKGSGHLREVFLSKTIRELLKLGALEGANQGKNINLNGAGNLFYDVVANGQDKTEKVNLEFANFYNKTGPKTKEALRKAFGKRGRGSFGKDKQERDKKLGKRLSSRAPEEEKQKYSAELSRLFDTETLEKKLQLTYQVDDIDPERLKIDKRTTRGKELSKKLSKYLESTDNAADGYIPNFSNLVYDKDRIPSKEASQILQKILIDKKKKDLLIGPSGVGKSTLAARYGEFIKSLDDVQEANSYTIVSGAGKTKAGGMSPALLKIIDSVNKSGGRVSYLSASDETIEARREKRITSPIKGDLRSANQLKGTKFAPKNQSGFTDMIRGASNRFQIISAADGYIPNFGYQDWGMGRKSKPINWKKNQKTGKMSILSGTSSDLDGFGQYLKEVSEKYPDKVKASAAERFIARAKSYHSVIEKEKAEVNKNTPIGFGRQGRKHYDQMAFVSTRERDVDINGLFIKKLNDHVKQYNKHGYFAADKIGRFDSFLADGYIPNFFNEVLEQRRGDKKRSRGKRKLDMSYFFPMASKGASALKSVYKDIIGSAKAGRPYTDLETGSIIGPRIPKLLFEGHRLLEQSRARGSDVPRMKIDGQISPAMLMQKIKELGRQESEGISQSPIDYKSGEEKEVESYLQKLGLDPWSMKNANIGNLPIFSKGFADGFVPNFNLKQPGLKTPKTKRNLDLSWIAPESGGGSRELRKIYKDIEQSAKIGKPYTDIDAGFVVGPRIPRILVEGQRLLNRARSGGKKIPKMKLNGMLTPADLIKYINQNKQRAEEGSAFASKMDYKAGEEKEVVKYLKLMGLNPESQTSADLDEVGMFRNGYANGFIPNFANQLQEAIAREEKALKSQGSNAQVYVDQDNRLKGNQNPMGLLVANKKDEPSGGFQGVNRAMSMGMDPKTHGMASGYIPNFADIPLMNPQQLTAHKEQIKSNQEVSKSSDDAAKNIKKQGDATKDMGDESDASFEKLLAVQFALSSFETAMTQIVPGMENFSLRTTQVGASLGEISKSIGSGFGNNKVGEFFTKNAGKIGKLGLAVGILTDVYTNFLDTNNKAIQSLDREIKSRQNQANILSQNIEKIEQFAQSASRLGESLKTGNAEATAKFLQDIFKSGSQVASLDPSAFQEIINSLGDTEKFNEAIQNFKDIASAGKDLQQFGSDVLNLSKVFRENDDIGLDELQEKAGVTFENIGKSLTQNLPEGAVETLSAELQNFDSNAGNSSEKLLGLQSVLGNFDSAVVNSIKNQEGISSALIKQIQQQAFYSAQVNRLTQELSKAQSPIEKLSGKLNELGEGMIKAAQNSQAAINVLSQTGQIETKSNLERLQATSTVSQQGLVAGQAQGDINNAQARAAKEQSNVLKTFAGKLIQQNKEGTTTLSENMKALVGSISSGAFSPEEALKSLNNLQAKGDPEEKKLATETLNKLNGINQSLQKDTAITNANLQAQLRSIDAQAIAFQRNNQLSDSQLQNLGNINSLFQNESSLLKSQLEKLSEVKSAIELIEDLGGSSDIIAALKEENKQETQFENLQSAFEQLSGTSSEALNLDELNQEIVDFDLSKVSNEAADLILALNEAIVKSADSLDESGVKAEEDVEEVSTIQFDESEIDQLSTKMGEAVSKGVANALGISSDTANQTNQTTNIENLASVIGQASEKNAINQEKNQQRIEEVFSAFSNSIAKVDFSKLDTSSDNLNNAAQAMKDAVANLQNNPPANADGFVPNFAPIAPIEKALNTERAMGARKPVVDTHPSIGTYVRDAATQPNFSAVRRDHPEGISKAISNSRSTQGAKARGFVPNFAQSFFGGELAPEIDFSKNEVISKTAEKTPKGTITQKAAKALEKFKNLPVKEKALSTLKSPSTVSMLGGAVAKGANFIIKEQLGNIQSPSDQKFINAIYFGSARGNVSPYVNPQEAQVFINALSQHRIAEFADQKILSSNKAFNPGELNEIAKSESKNKFLESKNNLFDLSLGSISSVKTWGRQNIRNESAIKTAEVISKWGTQIGDLASLGVPIAMTLTPATGGVSAALAAGAVSIPYAIGSAADIYKYYADTGIVKEQINELSRDTLEAKLNSSLSSVFKNRSKQPDAFAISEENAAKKTLRSGPFELNAEQALAQIRKNGSFLAQGFLEEGSQGVVEIASKESTDDGLAASDLMADYQATQKRKEGFYRFSKKLVNNNITGASQFFTNLTKAKEFEQDLAGNFRLRLPFSFKDDKIGTDPTSWNRQELEKLQQDLSGKSKELNDKISLNQQTIANLESDETDPGKQIKIESEKQSQKFNEQFLAETKKAEKTAQGLKIKFDVSEKNFYDKMGGYDRLDGSSRLTFPSPTSEEYLKLRYPESPIITEGSIKNISIGPYSQLGEAANEALRKLERQTSGSSMTLENLTSLDFSNLLQNFSMLNPEGVSRGIDEAMNFFTRKRAQETKGGQEALPSLLDKDINILKQEKSVIDKFAQDKEFTEDEAQIAQNLFGEQGLDAIQKNKEQEQQQESKKSNIRDSLYLKQLGRTAKDPIGNQASIDAQSRIKRIESQKQVLHDNLTKIIEQRQKRVNLINSGGKRPGDDETLNRFQTEIEAAKTARDLYQTKEGTGFLYFTRGQPQVINGLTMPNPIWQSDQDYNQKFEEIQRIVKIQKTGTEGSENAAFTSQEDKYLFAMMRNQPGNAGQEIGAEFEKSFANASIDQRKNILNKFGLTSEQLSKEKINAMFSGKDPDNPNVIFSTTIRDNAKKSLQENLKSLSGGEGDPLSLLVNEILNHSNDTDQQTLFANAIQNIGVPFSLTSGVTEKLAGETVGIEHGGLGTFSVPALEPTDIEGIKRFTAKFQADEFAERIDRVAEGGGIGAQISAILGQASTEQIDKTPVFIQNQKSKLNTLAAQTDSVPNYDLWAKKYADIEKIKNLLNVSSYGNIDVSQLSQDVTDKHKTYISELISDQQAVQKIMGFIDHGKNAAIENMLANSIYPFEGVKVDDWAPRHEAAVSKILDYYKTSTYSELLKYAPFGYTQSIHAVDAPSGLPDQVKNVLATLSGKAETKNNQNNARGFVPNFSAVAGEIAASKTAGYKTPVVPSQVKTMSIPGVGKTSYNTQESVFKLPGMSQPFITPPSNSKAAKPYAKQVQKKFNFNPYKQAADGFVPNFAPNDSSFDASALNNFISEFSSVSSSFAESTTNFQQAVSNLNFQELASASEKILQSSQASENQSNALKEAASLIQQGANTLTESQGAEVDFSALTSAASTIQSSFESLASQLSQSVQIDSSAIENSMSALTSALQNINGTVDVDIPDVNVNINGSQGLINSVRSVIETEVPKLVASEISNLNIGDQIKNYLR